MGQDRERLALAVLRAQALDVLLRGWVLAQKQHRRFTEGPLQVAVTDLLVALAHGFAGRLFGALHEPGVGGKLLERGETMDVMDLVEDHERQYPPDTRYRAD